MARWLKLGFAYLLVVAVSCEADAERSGEPVDVPNGLTCPRCEITLDTNAILSGPPEAFVEWPQSAWVDSRGRLFLAQPNKRIPPAVFGPDGRFLEFLGREGDGPGEFRYAAHIAGDAHDSVFIADWGTRRLSIFGADLKFARSFAFPQAVQSLVILSDGRLVSNSPLAADNRRPIQRFSREGHRDALLGPPARGSFDYQFRIAPAQGGGFWAVRLWGRHLLGYFPADSQPRWYESEPAWYLGFPDDSTLRQPPAQTPVRGIWESSDGLVWIASQVADSTGQPILDTIRPEGVPVAVARDADDAFDTIVEVFDPRTAQLVAVRRFDQVYTVAAGTGRMLYVRETDAGLQFVLVRLGLKRH